MVSADITEEDRIGNILALNHECEINEVTEELEDYESEDENEIPITEVAVHEVEEENDIAIIDVGFREMTLTGKGS